MAPNWLAEEEVDRVDENPSPGRRLSVVPRRRRGCSPASPGAVVTMVPRADALTKASPDRRVRRGSQDRSICWHRAAGEWSEAARRQPDQGRRERGEGVVDGGWVVVEGWLPCLP